MLLKVVLQVYARDCFALRACPPDLSQPDMGIEFLNSLFSPQFMQTPLLVGPLGLSISHSWRQSVSGSPVLVTFNPSPAGPILCWASGLASLPLVHRHVL